MRIPAIRHLALIAAACAGLCLLAAPALAAAESPTLTASALADTQAMEYRLGSGDKVRVIVYGEESLGGEFFVSGNGKISLPLIGEVQAAGLTIRSLQDEVQTALSDGYLKTPKVSAEVLNYRPFFILGEVGKPGQYPYTNGLTVLNAVATAGGFTYRANKGKVFIKRNTEGDEHSYPITSATAVAPGDTIRISERLF